MNISRKTCWSWFNERCLCPALACGFFHSLRNHIYSSNILKKGFVCQRTDLSASGCCHSSGESTQRFECLDCLSNNCCSIYEHCVSCCLNPRNKKLLEQVLQLDSLTVPNVISKSVSDQFELCLVKCRTSSKSVWHENSYKDKTFKHCFGSSGPEFAAI
ncbi:SREBP regulating gene protein [Acropora cervicornis]|uniref:SREBP regulating gene protein n=1 Tax=Acropora cervicornis TaxID=6130 RepID=A0AAD9R6T5_ACRCE|nr:SREBP regulating gene protein [Acropora cervicornis]